MEYGFTAPDYARSLIEASHDPLVVINAQGMITDLNQAVETMTGLPKIELLGTAFLDYFTNPEMAGEVYKQVFANGFVKNYLITLRHKSGTLREVSFNGSVYKDENGNVLG